jgi:diaminopimelate decarboxylase
MPDERDDRDWRARIGPARAAAVVQKALEQGVFAEERAALFHDTGMLRNRLAVLKRVFPAETLHAIAIKANPAVELLRIVVGEGVGLEAASNEEVRLGLAAGCKPCNIVYDSPAKTISDLREMIPAGVSINADNLDELDRIAGLGQEYPPDSIFGLRVNPEVGDGTIAATSTATRTSKFGVSLSVYRRDILRAFGKHPWLNGLHVHVGSQGCSVDMLARAAAAAADLAAEINSAARRTQITAIDVGGGLSWSYDPVEQAPTPRGYLDVLKRFAPAVLEPPFRLVTEFGRAVQAGCGFAASRVEYVKHVRGKPMALIHVGADLLLRHAYQPGVWHHEFVVLDAEGNLKTGPAQPQAIAGPLCFSGDVLARGLSLPLVEPEDIVAILDIGAYTLGMWSRHCSRRIPGLYGFDGSSDPDLVLLRRAETGEDVVRFWGRGDDER